MAVLKSGLRPATRSKLDLCNTIHAYGNQPDDPKYYESLQLKRRDDLAYEIDDVDKVAYQIRQGTKDASILDARAPERFQGKNPEPRGILRSWTSCWTH